METVEGEGPDLKRRLKTVGSVPPLLDTPGEGRGGSLCALRVWPAGEAQVSPAARALIGG